MSTHTSLSEELFALLLKKERNPPEPFTEPSLAENVFSMLLARETIVSRHHDACSYKDAEIKRLSEELHAQQVEYAQEAERGLESLREVTSQKAEIVQLKVTISKLTDALNRRLNEDGFLSKSASIIKSLYSRTRSGNVVDKEGNRYEEPQWENQDPVRSFIAEEHAEEWTVGQHGAS